ncbi:MAG: hypothetical protein AABY22_04250 [Nanoarchaeota archaeon]
MTKCRTCNSDLNLATTVPYCNVCKQSQSVIMEQWKYEDEQEAIRKKTFDFSKTNRDHVQELADLINSNNNKDNNSVIEILKNIHKELVEIKDELKKSNKVVVNTDKVLLG